MSLRTEKRVQKEMREEQYALIDALPQFVLIIRPDGSIAYTNQRWRDYSHLLSQHAGEQEGFAHQQLDDCPRVQDRQHTLPHADSLSEREVWLQNLHPEDRERVLALQRQALAMGEPYEFEYRLRDRHTGAYRWFLSRDAPLRNEAGEIVLWVAICTEIDDLKRTEDAFLGMVSHELKTPLTSLKLQTQLLRKKLGKRDLPNVEVVCACMEAQLNAITRLVDELLDLSRIQAGKLEYAHETVDLDEILEEVVEMVQHMQTAHTIVVHHAASPAIVVGDRDRLAQVFLNVLSNAIKYAPDAPLIDVVLTASAEAITISVRDQGMGIPRELQGRIFERFYRAVPLQQRAFPGLGMGLYIVAEIVKHHKGTIRVESEKGKGVTFHLTFPLATSQDEVSRGREEE